MTQNHHNPQKPKTPPQGHVHSMTQISNPCPHPHLPQSVPKSHMHVHTHARCDPAVGRPAYIHISPNSCVIFRIPAVTVHVVKCWPGAGRSKVLPQWPFSFLFSFFPFFLFFLFGGWCFLVSGLFCLGFFTLAFSVGLKV